MPDEAARFENLVASHLLKWVHLRVDTQGEDLELRYFRDIDGREVDFVVTEGRAPVLRVECQWGDAPPAPGLRYLKARFPRCEAWQVSAVGAKDYETPEGACAPHRRSRSCGAWRRGRHTLPREAGQMTTIKISDGVNVDIAPDGTVYGVELLNANEQPGTTAR